MTLQRIKGLKIKQNIIKRYKHGIIHWYVSYLSRLKNQAEIFKNHFWGVALQMGEKIKMRKRLNMPYKIN